MLWLAYWSQHLHGHMLLPVVKLLLLCLDQPS
jgi:hypothetical protein